MKQKNILQKMVFALLCLSVSSYAQSGRVGINNPSPKATLDVAAKTTDGSQAEGFIAPRLTGDQIKAISATPDTGTMIYATAGVTATPSGVTAAITTPGYYYYDGTAWQSLSSGGNIYNADGTLTSVRTVTQGTNSLTFSTASKGSVVVNSADGVLDLQSTNSAIIVSRVASTSAITSAKNGMLIYDNSSSCFKFYGNNVWSSCLSASTSSPSVVSNCTGFAGSYSNGTPMSTSNKFSVTITNNSYSIATINFLTTDLVLSDVAGVTVASVSPSTATLNPGQSQLVEYTLGGTPTSSGTLTGTWTKLTLNCVKTATVNPSIIPPGLVLAQNGFFMLASIYDANYLPYTAPSGSATRTAVDAKPGFTNPDPLIDVQGALGTLGEKIAIPIVSISGTVNLPGYFQRITIPANLTSDNQDTEVEFSWGAQVLTVGTHYVTAEIRSSAGRPLNAIKLDINSGVGSDAMGIELGKFIYPYNSNGDTTNYYLRDMPGLPDKMFGILDATGQNSHMMLYKPMQAEDGSVWLNNNLGSNYANFNKTGVFNPSTQILRYEEYNSYGSLFQWGRKADGHELINWTSNTAGSPVNGTIGVTNDSPNHEKFITTSTNPYDWRVNQDGTLWATESSANNPCPIGFRLPTYSEMSHVRYAGTLYTNASALSSLLKFTSPGIRFTNGAPLGTSYNIGSFPFYWTSDTVIDAVNGDKSRYFEFEQSSPSSPLARASGASVRCIRN